MKKIHTPIPSDIAAEVLFVSDNTCCFCRERGKTVQIHHIDENPNNNVLENLAVLCLECHNKTQIKGGFGRSLNASLIIKYRNDWLKTVKLTRNLAVEEAVRKQVGKASLSEQVETFKELPIKNTKPKEPLLEYIDTLPYFNAALLRQAHLKWDTGVTATMVQASYNYIDSLTGVLVALARYYLPRQFGDQAPQEFFSDIIASRFKWHRTILEPYGEGGTIINVICAGSVLEDTERMVEDMVRALAEDKEEFNWENWLKLWRGEII